MRGKLSASFLFEHPQLAERKVRMSVLTDEADIQSMATKPADLDADCAVFHICLLLPDHKDGASVATADSGVALVAKFTRRRRMLLGPVQAK